MSKKYGYCALAALALAVVSPLATSATAVSCGQPSHNGYSGTFDGRFYTVVPAAGISWNDALAAAALLVNDGVQGRLATVNSFAEDEYVHCLIQATAGAAGKEAWIGGSQAAGSAEPAEGWLWINGELIDPTNTTGLNYTNWQAGEPNDDTSPSGNEKHLAASLGGDFGWNDEGRLGNIGAYVVEFGEKAAPFAATECEFGGSGCTLGEDGPVITFPENAVVQGNVEVRTWTLNVAPGLCGATPPATLPPPVILDLVPADGPLVIAPYLCSTDGVIKVTRTESPVVVTQGIIQITGTNKYGADDPVFPDDPTDQDIVVYRNTLASDQLEKAVEMGVDALFLGNVAETTNGIINPPRGAGGKGSYFIEGLRIQFPPGYAFSTNAAGNHTQMVALQRYKLKKAIAAVNAAKPALKSIDWLALKVLAESALYFHDRDNFDAALFKVRLLLKLNDKINYNVITGKNPYGEVAYRYLNAEDMYRRRIIPYD